MVHPGNAAELIHTDPIMLLQVNDVGKQMKDNGGAHKTNAALDYQRSVLWSRTDTFTYTRTRLLALYVSGLRPDSRWGLTIETSGSWLGKHTYTLTYNITTTF